MASHFKTIGIFAKLKNKGVKESLKALINRLQELNIKVIVESETAESLAANNLTTVNKDELSELADLLIVVGGDGSLIHAAHTIRNSSTPVVGINRGSLGFLTDIHPDELNKIEDILQGKFFIEKRFLLTASVKQNNKISEQDEALNEVAIIPGTNPHMIELEIYIDEKFVCSQNSDGLIIATPTGSTAYALSGGGPILHPSLDAIVIVPMFPHSLNNRPIVVEGNSKIDVIVTPNNNRAPRVSCDAREYLNTEIGGSITISKKENPLHLIHPLDYDYYEALRSKLHWGKKLFYSE